MKTRVILILWILIFSFTGCNKPDRTFPEESEKIFTEAGLKGKDVNEGLNRCLKFVYGWLTLADSATGLIPRNINDAPSKDIWNAKDVQPIITHLWYLHLHFSTANYSMER